MGGTKRTGRVRSVVLGAALLAVAGVTPAEGVSQGRQLTPCEAAFARAAAVDNMHDTHADLFPAYTACKTLAEWRRANTAYPDAIDGVDPIVYARNVCAGNQARLGSTPICKAVNAPPPATASSLKASSAKGLMGVHLPVGARLTERTAGDASAGRDPSERYVLTATADQIADSYDRLMPGAGWAKDGTSMKYGLFFQKGKQMIGVLINGKGGTFVLMGS